MPRWRVAVCTASGHLEVRAALGGLLRGDELPEFVRWIAWTATPAGQLLGAGGALRALVWRSVAARRFRRGAHHP